MNEQLRQLLVQCQTESIDGPQYPKWTDWEKFAQLVKEQYAASIVLNNMADPTYAKAMDQYYETRWGHRFD